MSVRIEISDLVVSPEQRALYNSIDKKYLNIGHVEAFSRNHIMRMYETKDGDCITNLLSKRSLLAGFLLEESIESVKTHIVEDIEKVNKMIIEALSL